MEVKDREGWPLRAGQRVRVTRNGVQKREKYEVVKVLDESAVQLRSYRNGGLYFSRPELCCVVKQTVEERDRMLRKARRELAGV